MTQKRHVIIVDDDPAVQESLSFLLEIHGFDADVFESGDAFLQSPISDIKAPVLMDVRMPGRDGIETLMAALAENPTLKIIIMSGHADIPLAVRALKSGAVDFIEKPFQADDILAVLEKHLDAGQTSITKSDPADSHLKNNESLSKLTQRETQIAHLLVEGLANKAVAHKLGISVRTVETHRARLMSKLSIRSLSELVKLVILTK